MRFPSFQTISALTYPCQLLPWEYRATTPRPSAWRSVYRAGIRGDFHRPAVISSGRANPAADRSWAIPTRVSGDIPPAGHPSRPRCLLQTPPDGVWVKAEDQRGGVDRRLLGADGQQGFEGSRSQVEKGSLALLIGLRLRNPDAATPVPPPSPHPLSAGRRLRPRQRRRSDRPPGLPRRPNHQPRCRHPPGIAPVPYRATEVEDYLNRRSAAASDPSHAAALAPPDARPMTQNAYKLPMTRNLVRRALVQLLPESPQSRLPGCW